MKSALQASRRLFEDILPNSDVADTSFPKAYKGPIDFKQENLFLWPLSEGAHSSSDAGKYKSNRLNVYKMLKVDYEIQKPIFSF